MAAVRTEAAQPDLPGGVGIGLLREQVERINLKSRS